MTAGGVLACVGRMLLPVGFDFDSSLAAPSRTGVENDIKSDGQECPFYIIKNKSAPPQTCDAESSTCTQAQRLARRLNNFHLASTTYTKIQRLSSKIIKNAIRGDFSLWKSFSSPEVGSPCKDRTTGLPAALASILRGRRRESKIICSERKPRLHL